MIAIGIGMVLFSPFFRDWSYFAFAVLIIVVGILH